jgi:hypothetical protein
LIDRHRLRLPPRESAARGVAQGSLSPELEAAVAPGDDENPLWLLKNVVAILVAMWIGSWVSQGFAALGLTLPAYIGAMLVAAAMRNLDDATGWLGLSERFHQCVQRSRPRAVSGRGTHDLKLWDAGLMFSVTILLAQVVSCRPACVLADGTRLRVGGDERRLRQLHARTTAAWLSCARSSIATVPRRRHF